MEEEEEEARAETLPLMGRERGGARGAHAAGGPHGAWRPRPILSCIRGARAGEPEAAKASFKVRTRVSCRSRELAV